MESSSSSNNKVAVVTGSSTGIGYETSLILARNGFLTYATMRNLNKSENIKSVATKENLPIRIKQLDVTDDDSVTNAIHTISSAAGRIDILVNNAGYGLNGAFEDLGMDEIKAQYETNVFGLIRTTQAVIPIMRRQKSGTIINISSGAGRFGFPTGMFTLNAVLVRYSAIITSFKVNKTATIILTRILIDEVTLRIEYIPRILQGIGFTGSDPEEFKQRIVNSFFKTHAMIFLEFARQIIPQGNYSKMTGLFEVNALGEYFRSLNNLYNPSRESIDSLIGQMRIMARKDEKLRGSMSVFENLLRST
jgi:NAD(P)-dependent dehydrogenase (short-subunit alcohol dehydrogenase family)